MRGDFGFLYAIASELHPRVVPSNTIPHDLIIKKKKVVEVTLLGMGAGCFGSSLGSHALVSKGGAGWWTRRIFLLFTYLLRDLSTLGGGIGFSARHDAYRRTRGLSRPTSPNDVKKKRAMVSGGVPSYVCTVHQWSPVLSMCLLGTRIS